MPNFAKWFKSRGSSSQNQEHQNSGNQGYSADFYDDTHLGYGMETHPRPIIEEPPDENEASGWAHADVWDGSNRQMRERDTQDTLALWSEDNFGDPFSIMRNVMSEVDSVFRNLEQRFSSFGAEGGLFSEGPQQGFSHSTQTIRRRRPDGSVYEETVTTRRSPDGTVEETRTIRDSSTGESRTITNHGSGPKALEGQSRRGPRIEECPDDGDQ
jgi:hypothetical protein